jgi:hypothetical protein
LLNIGRQYREKILEGVYTGDEKSRHLSAIRNLRPHADEVFEHDHLYTCLNILDSKAIGLLTYDAIVLAATSLVLSISRHTFAAGPIVIFFSLILTAVAASLCLRVIWVFWTETPDFEDPQCVFIKLLDVRNRRTICYRLAWVMSQAAMLLFIVGIFIQRIN